MIACPSCGGPVVRRQRTFLQRLVFRAVYRCDDCHRAASRPRSVLTIFKRYAECPRCGTHDLSRLAVKDRIDSTSPNPLRRILILLGCPLYHCTFCRMQFRDWRGRAPAHRPVSAPRKTRSTTSSA